VTVEQPSLWLVRHGNTEWAATRRHTGRTDIALDDAGRAAARALAPHLGACSFALALTSPLSRARETAALAGFPDAVVDPNLVEWDYGELEGLTTAEIRARGGAWATWTVFTGEIPGGETLAQVETRARAVLARTAAEAGRVICFGHGHTTRVLTAVALGLGAAAGARFALDPAGVQVIGREHELPVLRAGNAFAGP
jgi:probable phosphoglycerate mutase